MHRLDAAHLYRLVLEKESVGATYHGAADEGVPTRDIAKIIGQKLNLSVISKPSEEAASHFGWLGNFFAIDGPASSAQTRDQLGWRPTQPGLISDLNAEHYLRLNGRHRQELSNLQMTKSQANHLALVMPIKSGSWTRYFCPARISTEVAQQNSTGARADGDLTAR